MALIKCSECGKEVSSNSKACIHCGNPLNSIIAITEDQPQTKPAKKMKNSIKFVTIISSIVLLAVFFVSNENSQRLAKKEQAAILYDIYTDISKAYDLCDERFDTSWRAYAVQPEYDTNLFNAMVSSLNILDTSHTIAARELLKKIELDFNTNVEEAQKLLPNQYNELTQMLDYVKVWFNYGGGTNPETDKSYATGPLWTNDISKYDPSSLGYDELEVSFLKEINILK